MPKDPHAKKRKKQLAEKKRLARRPVSLAYYGMKYKKEEFVRTLMHAEIGIYEGYVMSGRKIFDHQVVAAVERLIRQMRAGASPLSEAVEINYGIGREEDLLVELIRMNWTRHFADAWRPPKDDLIGILRTILGSIETMRISGPRSQTYLQHIAGFLTKKLGVSVKMLSSDRTPVPEPDENEADELVRLGRQWNNGNPEARAEFFALAEQFVSNGQPTRVLDDCHLLLGEISDSTSEVVSELIQLTMQLRAVLAKAIP